jgi:PAS domain S-box-containing protein
MPENRMEGGALWAAVAESTEDVLIGTNLQSTITFWNPAAERLYGVASADAVGKSILIIVPPDRVDEEASIIRRIKAGDTIRDFVTLRRRQDGVDIAVLVTITPIRAADGDIAGMLRIARDVSGRDLAQRAARRLAAIVEWSDDAIVSKDLNGIVMSWNQAAEHMFGYSAAEMVGASIRKIIPKERESEEDRALERLRKGERVEHFETIRQRKDGSLFPVSLSISPILDNDGRIVGASKIVRDITDKKEAEAERTRLLAAAQAQVKVTENLNRIGAIVGSTLERSRIVQAVTDAATEGTGAEFGAFVYKSAESRPGSGYDLHALSGVPNEAFEDFLTPGATRLLERTFRGEGPIRIADVTLDPVPAQADSPNQQFPDRRVLRSYLAVPVRSRSGEVIGGMFFGHSNPDRFTALHEQLTVGISSWASVALENARLYVGVEEASRLKDDFLATLSHELRTPLNAILGYARMIRSGIVAGERVTRAVETIERNASALTQIVEDVLDVSRIISGKMRLSVQPVNLPDVVRNAIDAVLPAADAKGIQIQTVLDPAAAPISGDPDRLQQVIWNLVANAVKFTQRPGTVQVRVHNGPEYAEVAVSDTGIGIAADFLPHIFERFRQADAGITRERGGLGLGLGIARQLVEMHGGTIHADSAGEGKGSMFRVRLPLMTVQADALPKESSHPESQPGARISIPDLQGVRILAVDDDRDALGMMTEILHATGARVSAVDSASAALEALTVMRPDILVADLGMPRMDGFELIAQVRRHPDEALREIPAAALTAYARSEDRIRALKSGYQLHLSKPIDPSELMTAIASLARRVRKPL